LVPDVGVKVSEPMLPAGGSALAIPAKTSGPLTATAKIADAAVNRQAHLLRTIGHLLQYWAA
jgi:hypothetical protein